MREWDYADPEAIINDLRKVESDFAACEEECGNLQAQNARLRSFINEYAAWCELRPVDLTVAEWAKLGGEFAEKVRALLEELRL